MRTRTFLSRATAATTGALLVAGLAACSGGSSDSAQSEPAESESAESAAPSEEDAGSGGGGDICSAQEVLADMSQTMSDVDPSDLQGTLDQLEELSTTVEDVEAPAEVADDWGTLSSALRDVTDSLQAAVDDPTDAEAVTQVNEAVSALSDQSVQDAGQAVSTYTAENC